MHLATCLTHCHALLELQFLSPKGGVREGWREEMKDAKSKGELKTAQCEVSGSLVKKGGDERRKCACEGKVQG